MTIDTAFQMSNEQSRQLHQPQQQHVNSNTTEQKIPGNDNYHRYFLYSIISPSTRGTDKLRHILIELLIFMKTYVNQPSGLKGSTENDE